MSNQLDELRQQLDDINKEICHLITKRLDLLDQIFLYKKENHLDFYDHQRTQKMLNDINHYLNKTTNLSLSKKDTITKNFIHLFDLHLSYMKNKKDLTSHTKSKK